MAKLMTCVCVAAPLLLALSAESAFGQIPGITPSQPVQNPKTKNNQPQAPAQPGGSIIGKVLQWKNTTPWTLNVEVRVRPQQLMDANRAPVNTSMAIQTAAVVWPLPRASAGHECVDNEITSELRFNNKVVDDKPKMSDGYPSATRLMRWEMRNVEGTSMLLKVGIKVRASECVFDEALAMAQIWPSEWPAEAASAMKPQWFLDYVRDLKEKDASDKLLREQLEKWLNKADPRSMPPAKLAKVLMGKVQEAVNPSGDGMRYNHNSSFQGFEVQLPVETLGLVNTKNGPRRGTEIDIANALTAMCRVAGLPARTVYGWDMSDSVGSGSFTGRGGAGGERLRAWCEFALVDAPTKRVVWIPMDPIRQRRSSSRQKPIDKPWEFFGNNDELDSVIPIAFQIAPPTTVAFHGSPAFWGWLVTPEYPIAEQEVRFTAYQTASRGDKKPTK